MTRKRTGKAARSPASGASEGPHRMAIVPEWKRAVGTQLASVAMPVAICGEALVIRAQTFGWVDEIGKLRAEIVASVNALQPDGATRFATIVVLAPGASVLRSSRYVGRPRPRKGKAS